MVLIRVVCLFLFPGYSAYSTTYTVTTTSNGTGTGSIRWAINQANSNSGAADNIVFNLGGASSYTISGLTTLSLTDNSGVTIDGFSNGTNSGTANSVAVANTSTGSPLNPTYRVVLQFSVGKGFDIISNNNIIKGLVISTVSNSNPYTGIVITGSNNQVLGCFIGTDITGTVQGGANMRVGVSITNASGNTIGNGTAAGANLIAGLNGTGAGAPISFIGSSSTTGNFIKGNIIGLQKDGTSPVSGTTSYYGISFFSGPTLNTIGGTNSGDGNIISGFLGSGNGAGIYLNSTGGNIVYGNIIGPVASTLSAVSGANQSYGIYIANSPNNTIGSGTANARNIISGNDLYGIYINGSGSADNNKIQGNYIGSTSSLTDVSGAAQDNGIYLTGGSSNENNTIGGAGALANTIAFNTANGIFFGGSNRYNIISRNPIYNTSASMTKAINLNGIGNSNYPPPSITIANTTVVSGTASSPGDSVEVFKTDAGGINAIQYIGTAVVSSGSWSLSTSLNGGDRVIANVRRYGQGNTSEFSSSVCVTGMSVSPNSTICSGASVLLTASGNYTWSPSATLNSSTGISVIASPTTTTAYTVTGNVCGSNTSRATTVTVAALPTVYTPSDVSICIGSSTNLYASGMGGTSYTWSPSAGLNVTAGFNITAGPTITTTYTVALTSTNGCTDQDFVQVVVEDYPVITITPPNSTICAGSSVALHASGASTYSWSNVYYDLNPNYGPDVIANPMATKTFSVTGTTSAGCAGYAYTTIQVNSGPTVITSPATVVSICSGLSTTLSASGSGVVSYSWSPAQGLNVTTGASVIASPTTYTRYYVAGTGSNGCTGYTDWVDVAVNYTPVVTIAPPNSTICKGSNVYLYASGAGGGSYAWSPKAGLNNTNNPDVIASPTITTTYTVTGTSSEGCVGKGYTEILVGSIPTVSVSSNPTICLGANANLTAGGASAYTWLPSAGLNTTIGSNVIASPAINTTYTITGATSLGCTSKGFINVQVNSLPMVTVSGNASICIGFSAGLSAGGANSYSWLPTIGLNNPNISNPLASPAVTTTYTVIATTNGCSVSGSTEVYLVNSVPEITAFPGSSICYGSSTNLSTSGATSYSWAPASGLNTNTGSLVIAGPTITTNYTLTATFSGCEAVNSMIVTVDPELIVDAGTDVSVFVSGSTTAVIGGSPTASGGIPSYVYSWSPSEGLSLVNIANPVASPTATTTYTLTVTDAFGCTNTDVVIVILRDNVTYAGLKKKLDGGFYELNNNTLYFQYKEQYVDADNSLNYKIYLKPSDVVYSDADQSLSVSHGDNMYALGLSSLTAGKIYILEVANEKNEKWYLRFKR